MVYSPRIDVIVPPKEGRQINSKCEKLIRQKPYRKFLDLLIKKALNSDLLDFSINRNPRYFIGIELESATSIKEYARFDYESSSVVQGKNFNRSAN